MPTSVVYDTMRAALHQQLPAAGPTHLDTLALMVVGVAHSLAAQLGAIARALPLPTTQVAKEQRLRRWLDTPRITQATHYQPLIRAALHGLKGQRVHVLLDRVVLRDRHNILVVSVGFRRRSLPLVWVALPHRGKSDQHVQRALLRDALALLPPGGRVTSHGDSEFCTLALFDWIIAQGHHAILGVAGKTHAAATPTAPGRAVTAWVGSRTDVVYLPQVYLTQDRRGPVNVMAWWDTDDAGTPLVRAVMTDLPATGHTYRLGKRRMWIETVFRDWQSGGFHLDRTGSVDRDRFARLLLPLVIVEFPRYGGHLNKPLW